MEIKIIEQCNGAAEISINNINMLAVSTNLVSKIYKQISRQDLLCEPGIIIKEGKSESWECTESIEHNGKLIFPGPYLKGKTLAETIPNIDILLNLAIAFRKITEKSIPLTGLYTLGIFIPEKGGILIFPPNLINYITSQLSEDESVKFWQPYNHPDTSGNLQLSFTLGVLSYQLLSGHLPYSGKEISEIREKMRTSKPVDIKLLKPGIKENIASAINQSLSLKEVKMETWIELFKQWKQSSAVSAISKEEYLQIQKIGEIKQNKRQKQFKRKQFFARNWKTISVITAVCIFIASFSMGPIRKAMKPPVTAGMSAEEVVETYYNAIINMDAEIMEDCLQKGIGKKDINAVTNLYVISRVRTGYEGTSGLISAQDWNDGIISELKQGEQVYGIADLKIEALGNSTFRANYIQWTPNNSDSIESDKILPPVKTLIIDTLSLEKVKDIWEITKLERIRKKENQ